MKKISIAFLAVMSLAAFGCNKNKDGESIAKMTELKDKMCACKDKACSDTVSDELSKWTQEQAKAAGGKPPSKEHAEKTAAVTDEMIKCMLKLEIPGGAGAAGAAGGAGDTMGSGSPAAGSADGSAAAGGSAGGAAADSPGGSATAGSADGAAATGSAH